MKAVALISQRVVPEKHPRHASCRLRRTSSQSVAYLRYRPASIRPNGTSAAALEHRWWSKPHPRNSRPSFQQTQAQCAGFDLIDTAGRSDVAAHHALRRRFRARTLSPFRRRLGRPRRHPPPDPTQRGTNAAVVLNAAPTRGGMAEGPHRHRGTPGSCAHRTLPAFGLRTPGSTDAALKNTSRTGKPPLKSATFITG